MSMFDEVRAEALLAPDRAVLVMLSGGRDSVCLLDLAVRIAGPGAVAALHVNYALREAAAQDEHHCLELCASLGVPLEVHRPDGPPEGNLHAWARAQRYGAATQRAGERGAEIAAGHTSSDQVETILYRLASSPSRRALLGMRPREGILVRPLLNFTRQDTADYCRSRGLEWREDESNDAPAFARARVRGTLVPALRQIHPAAEANVLTAAVDGVLAGASSVRLDTLRRLPPALGRLIVQRLADGAAGGPAPGTARRLAEILALSDTGAASLHLPHGVSAVVRGGVLAFERTPHPNKMIT
jgi:tRNA(Ile)-lysidine synthase